EEGTALLADFITDAKTSSEARAGLLDGFRYQREVTPSTMRVLRATLDDRKPAVRVAALKVAETVRSKELIPLLVELLEDTELLQVKSDPKGDDSFPVARALGKQGKDAVPFLAKALGRRFNLVRFQAARALALIGKDAQDAVPALEKALDDTFPLIQLESAKAILKSGKTSDRALKYLESQLEGESELQFATLEALRDLGRAGRPLLGKVKKLTLRAGERAVQRAGFDVIRAMQADPKEVVESGRRW